MNHDKHERKNKKIRFQDVVQNKPGFQLERKRATLNSELKLLPCDNHHKHQPTTITKTLFVVDLLRFFSHHNDI